MKTVSSWVLAIGLAVAVWAPSVAQADIPAAPCEGAAVGDPCVTEDLEDGTCQGDDPPLTCVVASGTTTGATTGSGSTAAGGEGGGSGEGGGGSSSEDSGCTVSAVGAPAAAGSMTLLGLAVIVGARAASRRKKA